MNLKINSQKVKNVGVIRIQGEIDMFTSPSLREKLLPFFNDETRGIIVDLSAVSFMDSSGIATLVEGLQWSKKEGKKFILTGLGDNVKNALALTKLDNVFDIRVDIDDVLKGINAD